MLMNSNYWILIGAAVVIFLLLKRMSLASPKTTKDWLEKGAKVIDVRGVDEYQDRHLPGTINIPLDHLRDEIGQYAPNKDQGLLLHCLSGGRSAIAKGMLKRMGYGNVLNLGSYGRAAKILNAPITTGKTR